MSFYLCFFAGLLSGVLGGMGMGGGTVLIPVLTLLFAVPQKIAQTANLVSFLPMAALSLKIHADNRLVRFRGVFYVILPAVAFSVACGFIAKALQALWMRRGFGAFLCLLAIFQCVSAVNQFTRREK